MAGIMHKTSRLMAAVLLGCLLAGCGGQLLSHREIVRAVFFTAQDAGYTVTLLTSDQQSEDSAACKTFIGSQGEYVSILQEYLSYIAQSFPEIPEVPVTGVFGNQTQAAVIAYQNLVGLEPSGIVGPLTWNSIASLYGDLRFGFDKQPGQDPGYTIPASTAEAQP